MVTHPSSRWADKKVKSQGQTVIKCAVNVGCIMYVNKTIRVLELIGNLSLILLMWPVWRSLEI